MFPGVLFSDRSHIQDFLRYLMLPIAKMARGHSSLVQANPQYIKTREFLTLAHHFPNR